MLQSFQGGRADTTAEPVDRSPIAHACHVVKRGVRLCPIDLFGSSSPPVKREYDPTPASSGAPASRRNPTQDPHSHGAHRLALVGDSEVVRALRHMPHKIPLDGGIAGLCEHLVLLVPGGMDSPPAHLAILIVDPGPEEWLTKFF